MIRLHHYQLKLTSHIQRQLLSLEVSSKIPEFYYSAKITIWILLANILENTSINNGTICSSE